MTFSHNLLGSKIDRNMPQEGPGLDYGLRHTPGWVSCGFLLISDNFVNHAFNTILLLSKTTTKYIMLPRETQRVLFGCFMLGLLRSSMLC
ncbi:MAG: hypothetical protein M3297_10060, partial [Thermoproteota archaeon]|nr:hypothetical protein [Thermoproteota archaeon]